MAITAEQVRELRDLTGAGMMDCKRALEEAGGDSEKAVALLREKGLTVAAKKAGRLASEGTVAAKVVEDRLRGALVEINCETDFVAKNNDFMAFVGQVVDLAATAEAVKQTVLGAGEELKDLKLKTGESIGEALTGLVAKLGENMTVRRYARFAVQDGQGAIESYIHMGGKIGVLVELSATKKESVKDPAFLTLARDLAMQVAAAKPEYVSREEVDPATVEGERAIYKAQAINEGKPEQVAEKIVLGRLEKFYKEVCLLEQPFIKDTDRNCAQVIKAVEAQLGEAIAVKRFARFERGEGLAKRSQDFAAEVQAQLKGH
ncbi:MAG: translation elongation factor Ts [Bacteroidota bacterium]